MGARYTKPTLKDLQTFEDQSKTIEQGLDTIQLNLSNLSQNLLPRKEVEERLEQVQTNHLHNNERLAQLIEVTKDQQQVIFDLNQKYTKLFDECYTQQKVLTDLATKYQDKLNNCEQELLNARNKLYNVERDFIASSEYTKVLGIRKTENMIKKERITPRAILKKDQKPSPINVVDKAKQKLQNARDQKKILKGTDMKVKAYKPSIGEPVSPINSRVIEERDLPEVDCVSETFMEVQLDI